MSRSGAVIALVLCGVSLSHSALAGPKQKRSRSKATPAAEVKEPKPEEAPKSAEKPATATGRGTDPSQAPSPEVKEAKQTDAGSSYSFGELEIEGRLKTPQIVYFLRRVRAEFAARDLGHRSFMGELHETKKEPSF